MEVYPAPTCLCPLLPPSHATPQVKEVTREPVRCSALSMAFFDRLYEKGVLRPNGAIKGCMPEYVDGVEINSELTKVGCRVPTLER